MKEGNSNVLECVRVFVRVVCVCVVGVCVCA